jgi:thioredoxin reductase
MTVETGYDVVVVGGGPAGLSAALTLGRSRRTVLLVDGGRGRNAPAPAVHGFLTQDGTSPAGLRELARKELEQYPTVELRDATVKAVRGECERFTVVLDGEQERLRRIVLADGAPVPAAALFVHGVTRQASDLPEQLGSALLDDGSVAVVDQELLRADLPEAT